MNGHDWNEGSYWYMTGIHQVKSLETLVLAWIHQQPPAGIFLCSVCKLKMNTKQQNDCKSWQESTIQHEWCHWFMRVQSTNDMHDVFASRLTVAPVLGHKSKHNIKKKEKITCYLQFHFSFHHWVNLTLASLYKWAPWWPLRSHCNLRGPILQLQEMHT